MSGAKTHDTGSAINKSMFWAADMKLTEILATTCGLTSERFASSINNQPAFGRSYSARRKDSDDFGLTFDGIRRHFRRIKASTQRRFLDSSYVNCKYRDDMIETTMRGCFKSLETATKAQRPVRHIFFLPFDSAKKHLRCLNNSKVKNLKIVAY